MISQPICCIAGSLGFAGQLPAPRKLVHAIGVRKGIILEVGGRRVI